MEKFILRCTLVWVLVTLSCVHNCGFPFCFGTKTNDVCKSKECKSLGDSLKKSMNPQGNPCVNFYDYVCHRWVNQNPPQDYIVLWTVEESMAHRAKENLQRILEDKKPTGNLAFELAKRVFKACVNLPGMPNQEPDKIKQIMKKIGNWPMFFAKNQELPRNLFWSDVESKYIQKSGQPALFNYYTLANSDANGVILYFSEPFSVYGVLNRQVPWVNNERAHYKNFLKKVIKSVAPSDPAQIKNILERDLEKVLEFRDRLNQTIANMGVAEIQTMTVSQFHTFYNKETSSMDAKVDWLELVRGAVKDAKGPDGLPINAMTIIKFNKTYFKMLAKFLSSVPKRVIVNNAHIYFAERHVKLTPDMTSELDKSYSTGIVSTGNVIAEASRGVECVYVHNMDETLGKMYINSFFPKAARDDVIRIFEEAKLLLQKQIADSNWVDSETKIKTLQKAKHMEYQIGYPDTYESDSAMEGPYDVNPLEADAYYVRGENKIYVSAGELQWPIYHLKFPDVIHYGTLYSLFGHEFYHGFDKGGIQYDVDGAKRTWWPIEMYNQLMEQRQCFKNQYEKYRNGELSKYNISASIDLPSTTEEDVADVMGLKLAYRGFFENFQKKNGACTVIPGFENERCDKLFFIAFASTFCQESQIRGIQNLLANDLHSIPKIRVNGAVANLPEFSAAFDCKPGDPLKLSKTCDIWQK